MARLPPPAEVSDGRRSRLIVDASTLIRWRGPPVGIMRVEAEIIRYHLDHEPAALLCVFDTRSKQFRSLDGKVARLLIERRAAIDTSIMPDPRAKRLGAMFKRLERRLRPPRRLRDAFASALLEWKDRLSFGSGSVGDRVLDALISDRARARIADRNSGPLPLPLESVLGPPLRLGPFDIILSAGADWNTKDPDAISTLKSQTGFRFVMVCYDLIPVLSPQFYSVRDATVFAHYFRAALGFADRFICISQRTARDLAEFAVAQGHYDADICTERLGADAIGQAGGSAPLPAGLASERYVLFVSTIEPRKNHALLLRVWRRLAAGEHGGTAGFKLVFAGRPGWMTQDIVVALSRETVFKRDVLHIPSASDPELDALFEHAAFTVYPSHYEGFGLPVIESLAHGTPAIVSSAGSLPEAVAGLGPCVDPTDDDGWAAAMGRWINDPAQLAEQARRIRAEFSWPSWSDAAGRILTLARGAQALGTAHPQLPQRHT